MVMSHACKLLPGSNRHQLMNARSSVYWTRWSARWILRESEKANERSCGIVASVAALKEASVSPGIGCACFLRGGFAGQRRSRAGRAIAVALLSAASAAFASIQRIGEPSAVDALSSMTCARTVMDHCLLSSEAAGRGEEHGPAAANPAAGGVGTHRVRKPSLGFALVYLQDRKQLGWLDGRDAVLGNHSDDEDLHDLKGQILASFSCERRTDQIGHGGHGACARILHFSVDRAHGRVKISVIESDDALHLFPGIAHERRAYLDILSPERQGQDWEQD